MSRENPSFPNNYFSDAARRAVRSIDVADRQRRVDREVPYRASSNRGDDAATSNPATSSSSPQPPSAPSLTGQDRAPQVFTPARPISLGSLNRLRIDPAVSHPLTENNATRFDAVTSVVYPATFEITTKPWTIVTADFDAAEHPHLQTTRFDTSTDAGNSAVEWEDEEGIGLNDQLPPSSDASRNRTNSFSPSWEVDTLFWPEVVIQLEESNPQSYQQIGQHLAQSNRSGLRILAVTSGERGVGRSTVAMHLTRAASAAGLNVALVDADVLHPSLLDQLKLDIDRGWQHCLLERLPLEESAVYSIEDRITLFPITQALTVDQFESVLPQASKFVQRIASHFDLVILDSCRINAEQPNLIGFSNEETLDAAVIVVDSELSVQEKVDNAIGILQAAGLTSIGIVENFRS
ncbi:MAG: P-loop NTPase [Planctomycetota bacterium]